MEQLPYQYQLIKESRAVVFRFLANKVEKDIFKPVSAFNDKNIAWMMLHIANTYLFWAGNFSLKLTKPFYEVAMIQSIVDIEKIFESTDKLMLRFIETFGKNIDQEITGLKSNKIPLQTNAFAVFTHMITHEFHHKGQIMSMCRLLGHIPPDADVIR